ncbi:hypothetical protein FOCC_FOCC013926 [Frankliniella occidentalis]|nr:hypothetical protein FOCC_FOCC013926 [Frankliniella occidentalis]
MSPKIKKEFQLQTAKDPGLMAVREYYQNGWPHDQHQVASEAKPYWALRHDLFSEDGLVVLEDKVVVPVALRRKALTNLHGAHLNVDKTKTRARQMLYWPGLNSDIQNMIAQCRTCERHGRANYKEPLLPHDVTHLRFQKVGCDILSHNQNANLVKEDYLSHWLEIKPLQNKSARAVINALRQVFATHGLPDTIFGDNNPLNSFECHEYAREIGCEIITSSPEYPKSKGMAEKGVGSARKLLDRCHDSGMDMLDALREYNNTPLSGMQVSLAEILVSRRCRTLVPSLHVKLEPKVVDVRPELKQIQAKVKRIHDRRARRRLTSYLPGGAEGKMEEGTDSRPSTRLRGLTTSRH